MFSKRFFEEYGKLQFRYRARGWQDAGATGAHLGQNGGEDIVEIFGAVALILSLPELTAELWVVAVLPQLVVLGASLLITQYFPASATSLNRASASVSLLTSG